MKRFFLMTVIAVSSFGMINAQNAAGKTELPQVRAKKMVSQVNTAVALHGDQFGKVNNAYIDYFTKLDALEQQKGSMTASEYESKAAALKNNVDASVKA